MYSNPAFQSLFFFFDKLRMHHLSCAFSLCSTLKSSLRKIEVLRFLEIFGNGWNGFRQHHCGQPPGSIAQPLESFEVGEAWSGRQVSLIRPSHRRRRGRFRFTLRFTSKRRCQGSAPSPADASSSSGSAPTGTDSALGPPPRASQGSAPSLAKLIQLFGQCAHGTDSVHRQEQARAVRPHWQIDTALRAVRPRQRTRSTPPKSKARAVCPHWQIQYRWVALWAVRPRHGLGPPPRAKPG